MATFVDLSLEDQAEVVALFLGSLTDDDEGVAFADTCKSLVAKGDVIEYFTRVSDKLTSHGLSSVAPSETERSVETCVFLLTNIASECESKYKRSMKLLDILVNSIASDSKSKSKFRLKLLCSLFNSHVASVSGDRFSIFLVLVSYAGTSKHISGLIPQLGNLDNWLDSWRISEDQRRLCYSALASALQEDDGDGKSFYNYATKMLSLYENGDASTLAAIQTQAKALVLAAIRSPSLFQLDHLLEFAAIHALEQSNENDGNSVFNLLKIFSCGGLAEYRAFINSKAPDFLSSLSLSADDLECKMRLLVLTDLFASSNDQSASYVDVANAISVDVQDVEGWVIKAITADLIDAKIDQAGCRILATRATQRTFTAAHWEGLSKKIAKWKGSVESLLSVLQSTKEGLLIAEADVA